METAAQHLGRSEIHMSSQEGGDLHREGGPLAEASPRAWRKLYQEAEVAVGPDILAQRRGRQPTAGGWGSAG